MSEASLPPDNNEPLDPTPQIGEQTAAAPADAAGETDAAWIAAADSDHDDAVAFSQELEIRPAPEPGTLALVPGQKVRGKILAIGEEQAIVSLSGRPDAMLATREFRIADGTLFLRVNDAVTAVVQVADVPAVLTLDRRRLVLNAARLRISHEQKQPVTGSVRAVNKGGFEVRVAGVRCFCPLSQMDAGLGGDAQSHVGQTYTFRILRWEHGGRSIVLSRRVILREEAVKKATETRKLLAVDAEFDGVVTRIQPFGAFVDIGGIEGLLHVSRMGRGHVTDPTAVVSPGQAVRVRVTKIDDAGTGKERVALAATDLGPDPWTSLPETLRDGTVMRGRVVRLTEFGAFVNLVPGIDGLVHISDLQRRGESEATPLATGDEIDVRVLRVDPEKRRVSLSLRLQPPQAAPRGPRDAREVGDARPSRRSGRPQRRDRERDR